METLIENKLINILEPFGVTYVKIPEKESLYKIYELFTKDVIFEPTTPLEHLYLGLYYKNYKTDYKSMKKHYKIALDQGDSSAMNNLGCYYNNIQRNRVKMEKYHLMGIEHGDEYSMTNLGLYYSDVEYNYGLMEKYLGMAIEKGHTKAMCYLAKHYYTHRNFEKMKTYYLMAIDKKCTTAMLALGQYYEQCENNIDLAKKYYLMMVELGNSDGMLKMARLHAKTKEYNEMKQFYVSASDHGNKTAMFELANHYECVEHNIVEMKKYLMMAIKNGDNISLGYLADYYLYKEDNPVEAFNLYMLHPNVYHTRIKNIIKDKPDFLLHILLEHNRFKDALQQLRVDIEDLKCRPDGEVFEDCRERWNSMVGTEPTPVEYVDHR